MQGSLRILERSNEIVLMCRLTDNLRLEASGRLSILSTRRNQNTADICGVRHI